MRPLFLVLIAFAPLPAASQSSVALLADIRLGPEGSSPGGFTSFDGALYFTADDGAHGREIWRIADGPPELLLDLNPGPASSNPGLSLGGGHLFVSGHDGNGTRLWRLEGDSLVPIAGSEGTRLSVAAEFPDGRLLLYGATTSLEYEPWIVEGDSARELDLSPGSASTHIYSFDAVGGLIYFARGQGGVQPRDLWATDGKQAWIVLDAIPEGRGVQSLLVHDERLLLLATTAGRGHELWVADSEGQVRPLPEAYPGPEGIFSNDGTYGATVLDEAVYVLDTSQERGDLLWEVRGDSVTRAAQIAPPYPPTGVAQVGALLRGVVDGETVLDQYDDRDGSRRGFLWKGDGHEMQRIFEYVLTDDPMAWLAPVGDRGYFAVNVIPAGAEMFEVVGDTAWMLPELHPGPGFGWTGGVAAHGGRLYVGANDGVHGAEPWVVIPPAVAAEPSPRASSVVAIERVLPNPAAAVASVVVRLRGAQPITVEVLDAVGRVVVRAKFSERPAGRHTLPFEVAGLAPGLYVVRIRAPQGAATARLVVAPR